MSRTARSRFNADIQAMMLMAAIIVRQINQPLRDCSLKPANSNSNCAPEVTSCAYSRRSLTSMETS
ncbi:MAG: hypothetical protein OEV15_08595 [Gallionella sp.]|nr:hypothetical protein [Gallionella sp.]